jgi:hypothetical protein
MELSILNVKLFGTVRGCTWTLKMTEINQNGSEPFRNKLYGAVRHKIDQIVRFEMSGTVCHRKWFKMNRENTECSEIVYIDYLEYFGVF